MKKNKKGFTLIELLAVIVILAIIALIAVPIILNIIDKANKSAFKDSAYGIISAGELYFAEQQLELDGMLEDKEFSLPSQVNTEDGLQLKGKVPEGTLKINTEGKIALAITNGRYCITKGYDDTDVTVSEDFEECNIPRKVNPNIISVSNECAINGQCTESEIKSAEGVKVTVQVNENETKDFYVIADNGTELTLIMSENLGDTVAWYADAYDNSHGPTTAIAYLNDLTDEEWSNIPKKAYTYSGIAEDGETRVYEDITETMRVRMITYEEATEGLGCTTTFRSCPNWLYANLDSDGNTSLAYGYWTSTAYASSSDRAWLVDSTVSNGFFVRHGSDSGVRPVIELSK